MRVLVDATAVPVDRGGVGRYLDFLLPALAGTDVDLVVVSQSRDAEALAARTPGAEVVAISERLSGRPARLAWEQTRLPALARRTRADVVHHPHYTMPLVTGTPGVVTLHDATFFSHPEVHSTVKARFFRSAIRGAVRRAAALVVPSAATRDAVIRYAGGRSADFHVAPHGVDTTVFRPAGAAEVAAARQWLELGPVPYVAFLGTLEPRKNAPALVRAWVRAVTDRDEPPALVLAGGPGWDEELDGAIAAVPAHLRVVRPGYVPLEHLAGLLTGSEVLAYPSKGEGFGLPVLEAMACGAAVLTTRELSLPEVGGEAVAYCGTDEASIAVGLRALLEDPGLRRRLAEAGLARAAGFTWASSARVHLEAYRAAAARRDG